MQTSAIMFQAIIQFITGDAIEQSAKNYVNGFISESFAMHLLTLPSNPASVSIFPKHDEMFRFKFMSILLNATCNMKKIISPVIFFLYKSRAITVLNSKTTYSKNQPSYSLSISTNCE